MNLIEPKFIEKKFAGDSSSDFESLVAEAVNLVQQLSGHVWTDYNLHDPGLTIIEQLCFTITDLIYRTEFPIEDILTDAHGYIHRLQHAFFEKEHVLTCSPITINDFRKFLLDEIEELDNVMLTPIISEHAAEYIKGLYKILIRVTSDVAGRFETEPGLKEQIKENVVRHYVKKRNLSEDLIKDIILLEPQKIQISADITIKHTNKPEEVLVSIYNQLKSLLNPKISFYTEKELLDRGMKTEEIYCGPLLKNGFIPDDELKEIEGDIDPIELANAISQVEDVLLVQNIRINNSYDGNTDKPFMLDKNCFPLLDISSFCKDVSLYSDQYKLQIKENVFHDLINRTAKLRSQKRKRHLHTDNENFIKMGTYRDPGKYYSLQNNFPVNYGISKDGISVKEPAQRKAAAKQLKAYLLFFEQILANYLAQLKNIHKLYSTDTTKENQLTYYYQPLYEVPGIEELLTAFTSDKRNEPGKTWDQFIANSGNSYLKTLSTSMETYDGYLKRKEKILDHLLARFNIKLSSFPMLQYFNTYMQGSDEEKGLFLLKWKSTILDRFIQIDQGKISAIDYLSPSDDISGFETKINLYLYIQKNNHRRLSAVFESGKVAFIAEKPGNNLWQINEEELFKSQWSGEYLSILAGADEIIGLSEIGKLIAGGINQDQAYIFRNQGVSILKYGIHLDNYKIGPSLNNPNEYIVIYKSPLEEKWRVISRHSDKHAAIQTLDKLIELLRKLSMESEGFHILEHVLLRPEIHNASFGFRFCSGPGEVIFENDQWTSFEEREDLISEIKKACGTESVDKTPDPSKTFKLKKTGHTNTFEKAGIQDIIEAKKNKHASELKLMSAELEKLNRDRTRMYPRFEMLVRLPDGKILSENFYNMQATIALPSWPARFQDKDFRSFAENLLRTMAPAYLRLQFMWIGVARMKKFEDLYFPWTESLKKIDSHKEQQELASQLTLWLLENKPSEKQ